jgi:uncharacterized protein YajQ (UPF0234 family)
LKINETVNEFERRLKEIRRRFELLKLEDEITEYMDSEEYKSLQQDDKNALDDILMEILNKKEYFQKGCDPWKSILKT